MDPAVLLLLIEGLPDTSMTAALAQGGEENWRDFLGWGQDRNIAAHNYDMLTVVARAAGNWAKKPPDIPMWPYPWSERAKKQKKPATLQDVYAVLAGARGAKKL